MTVDEHQEALVDCPDAERPLVALVESIQRDEKARLIFRGDCLTCLAEQLDVFRRKPGSTAAQMFVVGVKAKAALEEASDSKGKYRRIEASDPEVSRRIFRKIKHVIQKHEKAAVGNPLLVERLSALSTNSAEFWTYFRDATNRDSFVSSIESLPVGDRMAAQLYYAAFLHTVGLIGMYGEQHLSASLEYEIARGMAEERKHIDCTPCKHRPIVIIGWVPCFFFAYGDEAASPVSWAVLDEANLPFVRVPLWPEQAEVSLRGGWYPHYIIGYIDIAKRAFVMNPRVFNHRPSEALLQQGLGVSIIETLDALQATAFRRCVLRINDEAYYSLIRDR